MREPHFRVIQLILRSFSYHKNSRIRPPSGATRGNALEDDAHRVEESPGAIERFACHSAEFQLILILFDGVFL